MMDRVLVETPLGVFGFYAQEYDLAKKIQGDVDESIVSIALAFTSVSLKSIAVLTISYQNQLIRQKFDSGMGNELFEKYRAAEKHGPDDFDDMSKYLTIVFAAMMMEYGATIKEDHIKHLRDLVPKIHCNEGPANPLCDHGFRGPGKRQFLAALDNYQAGKPRSFQKPSCHNCGKINDDINAEGKTLLKCGGCGNRSAAAWFCDKVQLAVNFHFTVQISDISCRTAREACGSTISATAVLLSGAESPSSNRTARKPWASLPTMAPMCEGL